MFQTFSSYFSLILCLLLRDSRQGSRAGMLSKTEPPKGHVWEAHPDLWWQCLLMFLSIDLNLGLPKNSLIFLLHSMFLEFRVNWELSGHPHNIFVLSNPEVPVKRIRNGLRFEWCSLCTTQHPPKHAPHCPSSMCMGGGWVVLVCLSSTHVNNKIKSMYHTIMAPPAWTCFLQGQFSPVSSGFQFPHILLQVYFSSSVYWRIPGRPCFLSIPSFSAIVATVSSGDLSPFYPKTETAQGKRWSHTDGHGRALEIFMDFVCIGRIHGI